jgi:hypothetical protein
VTIGHRIHLVASDGTEHRIVSDHRTIADTIRHASARLAYRRLAIRAVLLCVPLET